MADISPPAGPGRVPRLGPIAGIAASELSTISGCPSHCSSGGTGSFSAASCGAWPVSISVFIRSRSPSIFRFGSEPSSAARTCPSAPAGGWYDSFTCTRVRPADSRSKRSIPVWPTSEPGSRRSFSSFSTSSA